ncbi:hypothetical protein QLR68_15385, partial [Micromonospora sp. DH15]|nr:hypothetical protein [Micromonospora sp. DH15]
MKLPITTSWVPSGETASFSGPMPDELVVDAVADRPGVRAGPGDHLELPGGLEGVLGGAGACL